MQNRRIRRHSRGQLLGALYRPHFCLAPTPGEVLPGGAEAREGRRRQDGTLLPAHFPFWGASPLPPASPGQQGCPPSPALESRSQFSQLSQSWTHGRRPPGGSPIRRDLRPLLGGPPPSLSASIIPSSLLCFPALSRRAASCSGTLPHPLELPVGLCIYLDFTVNALC